MEHRLFDPASPPEWADPAWWRTQPHCNHLDSPTGAHVARLHAAARIAATLAGPMPSLGAKVTQITDLGAGDGAGLELICANDVSARRRHAWGYDIITADVEYARSVRGQEVHEANVREKLETGGLSLGDVVVLTEVLEHMADPHGFLDLLAHREEVRHVVASSPHGETPDAHEWNHLWAWDEHGYAEMFEAAGFEVRSFERVEWSQVWAWTRRVGLTTEGAVAALEDERVTGAYYGNGEHFDHAEAW